MESSTLSGEDNRCQASAGAIAVQPVHELSSGVGTGSTG